MLNRFDKIFLIDINPGNDEITKEMVMGRLSRIVKNASIYQNIVITSHSNLVLLKKLVNDIGIKIGYIVSDNGARVYSIIEDRVIFETVIKSEDVSAATHFSIMEGSLVLASGSSREYAYSVNLLNALALNKKHYVPLPYTNDYGKFIKFLGSTNIHSLLIFQKERNNMLGVNDRLNVVLNDWDLTTSVGQSSYFIITSRRTSKYNAVVKIMENLRISNIDRVFYYAVNTIDAKCVRAFKNRLIYQDIAFRSEFIDKISVQANIDGIVTSMQRAFFTDEEGKVNAKFTTKEILDINKLHTIMNEVRNTKKIA